MHPTPAVGGEPWPEAAAAIVELEQMDRGWYAGPVGWMDATEDGEFCVALRSALLRDREAHLYAGVGVVADSDPAAELAETEIKLGALLPLLSGLSARRRPTCAAQLVLGQAPVQVDVGLAIDLTSIRPVPAASASWSSVEGSRRRWAEVEEVRRLGGVDAARGAEQSLELRRRQRVRLGQEAEDAAAVVVDDTMRTGSRRRAGRRGRRCRGGGRGRR